MEEVAGILIGDAEWERIQFGGEAEGGEKFGDIANSFRKYARLRVLGFVKQKKMSVFLERGAAAGGVCDDGVEIIVKKDGHVSFCEIASGVADSGVRGESAAAELSPRDDDLAAVGGEDADGGFIEPGEGDVGDAAGEESDASAARACGGIGPAKAAVEKIIINAREKALAIGEAEKFQDADGARNGLQAGALVEAENTSEIDDAVRTGKQVAEDEVAGDLSQPGTFVIALDAGAGVLDEFAVLDAGGAGGFAGAAIEAFADVVDERVGDQRLALRGDGAIALNVVIEFAGGFVLDLALGDMDHLVDAAAGGIGFEIPEAVGGAGVEAKAAVDAAGVVLVGGSLAGNGRHGHVGNRYGG